MLIHGSTAERSPSLFISLYLSALIIRSFHITPSCFLFLSFSEHALTLCLQSVCPMIALFIPTITFFLFYRPRRHPSTSIFSERFAYSSLFPPMTPHYSSLCWVKLGHFKALMPECVCPCVCAHEKKAWSLLLELDYSEFLTSGW